ncbi:uncharacterized protein [Physcomitrium patens]|uniref:Uncharacterized protein n=1 Tax=Physcomitrium patens TaxID=3218 RepID=A9TTW5_PHYPA|nr:uncharacterized protein LOC112292323 [Physcomitrium patens]XP_024396425.1 uncharacterized protein LOC112292323 [Physcomitrium patens]XP_024396426.1 uncharacterized protein LOC112292323 [Physcomitrium patens]PNR39235.1 hypothetical protein PHYPA_019513 [Physcomitrium patens]|eukprot:XP_024396424.1 uncharacterized protein LOC112292323 [Physcomitrella patens]
MARSDAAEMLEESKKRRWLMENDVNSTRAEVKLRPSSIRDSSRKKARREVTETDAKGAQDTSICREASSRDRPSRNVTCIGSTEKEDGEEEKLVQNSETRKSKRLKRIMQGSSSKQLGTGNAQKCQFTLRESREPEGFEHKKSFSERSFRGDDNSGDKRNSSQSETGPSHAAEESKVGEQKLVSEHEVVRKVLQTVHLADDKKLITEQEEDSTVLDNDNAGMVSSLEQTSLNSRDKKRRVASRRDASPPRQPEKRSCIHVAIAERPSGGVEQGVGSSLTSTWKRLKIDNTRRRPAASEDLRVGVSEDWKRLREEEGAKHSGSSVNEQSDSDLSMSTIELEMFEERSKKARHDPSLPPTGKKWTRKIRQKEENSKRSREHNEFETSSNSDSDIAHPSYLDNRRRKRPRFENLISGQGRSWKRHTRDVKEAQESSGENSRKRFQGDASEKPVKKQRK